MALANYLPNCFPFRIISKPYTLPSDPKEKERQLVGDWTKNLLTYEKVERMKTEVSESYSSNEQKGGLTLLVA